MTIQGIYQLAIKMGIEADPRGGKGVKRALERVEKEFEDLPQKKKGEFDIERLTNPYSDTRILFGDLKTKVGKILAGVDIGTGEVLLADRLNQKGEAIDLILGHHPHGSGLAALDEVMDLQVDLMAAYGVPVNVAEGILKERIAEVSRKLGPSNHYRSVDSARLLNLSFVCVHTPADNLGYQFLTKFFEERKPQTVGEVISLLKEVPEYKEAVQLKTGPKIFVGEEKSRAGKVVVGEFTGGTEGAKAMYEKLAQAGVGTIVGMHVSEEHRKEAKKYYINLVIAGHMASDSLGLNLLLDELQKRGVESLACSGLIRVSRLS